MVNKDNDKNNKKLDFIGRLFNFQRDGGQKENTDFENAKLLIAEWLAPKHVRYKTRYTSRQVRAVAILQSLADKYKIKTLSRYLKEFRVTKLSENSQSSKELESILKARTIEEKESNLERLSKYLD